MKKLSKFLLLIFISITFFQCSSKKELLTSEKIITQIESINGWSESQINRPDFYIYKIKRDSGYATVAISKQKKLLFGTFNYADYNSIEKLLEQHSQSKIKSQFKLWESKDERATAQLISIKKSSLGKYNSLDFGAEYNMNGRILSIDYKILLGKEGWILIGCSYSKSEKSKYKKEFDLILSSIGVKE